MYYATKESTRYTKPFQPLTTAWDDTYEEIMLVIKENHGTPITAGEICRGGGWGNMHDIISRLYALVLRGYLAKYEIDCGLPLPTWGYVEPDAESITVLRNYPVYAITPKQPGRF